jgi:hypothetical protein
LEPFVNRLGSQAPGITGATGEFERAVRAYLIQMAPESPGSFASSHRIENDTYTHPTLFVALSADSRGESVAQMASGTPA